MSILRASRFGEETRPVGEDFLRRRDCFAASCGRSAGPLEKRTVPTFSNHKRHVDALELWNGSLLNLTGPHFHSSSLLHVLSENIGQVHRGEALQGIQRKEAHVQFPIARQGLVRGFHDGE
jgi:hypothetical protein